MHNQFRYRFILAVIAAFYVVNGFLSFYLINDTIKASDAERASVENVLLLERLNKTIVDAETSQRGFILTEEKQYLIPYEEALAELPKLLDALNSRAANAEINQKDLAELVKYIRKKFSELAFTISLMNEGKTEQAILKVDDDIGLELMHQIDHYIKMISLELYRTIEESNSDASGKLNLSLIIIIPTNLVAVCIIVFFLNSLDKNMMRDISFRRRLEDANDLLEDRVAERTDELNLKTVELERSNSELENFAYVASHDLQEPLRKIRAFSDRLVTNYSGKLDKKGEDYLNRMTSASERMSLLIEDLLHFSRVSTQDLELKDIDLNELVESLIEGFIEQDEAIKVNVHPLPTVKGDSSQIERIFANLIGNAYKYKRADRPLNIEISASVVSSDTLNDVIDVAVTPEYDRIAIRDNGIGFDINFADKIFTMFQRLHNRSDYKGTGIGLAVCRKIAERHQGALFVEQASEDIGATFVLLLPKRG